jgi:hypothetical protein
MSTPRPPGRTAPLGQAAAQRARPHEQRDFRCRSLLRTSRPSGFEHQEHLRGQPPTNTSVLHPGPSCREKPWMSKTRPLGKAPQAFPENSGQVFAAMSA